MPHDEAVVASLTEILSNTLRAMTTPGEGLLIRCRDEIWIPTKKALEVGHCPGLAVELEAMMAPPAQAEETIVQATVQGVSVEGVAAGTAVVAATIVDADPVSPKVQETTSTQVAGAGDDAEPEPQS
eukprot:SAG31_NODE_5641_length_2408_cov_12.465497_3_plen_126_part_01